MSACRRGGEPVASRLADTVVATKGKAPKHLQAPSTEIRDRILVTGGTFDKEYDELTGRLYFKDTHVPEMLHRGRCRVDVDRDRDDDRQPRLDDRGRAAIVDRCRARRKPASSSPTAPTRWSRPRGAGRGARSRARPSSSPARWCPTRSAARTVCSTWARAVVRAGAAAGRLRRDERSEHPVERGAQEPDDRRVRGAMP